MMTWSSNVLNFELQRCKRNPEIINVMVLYIKEFWKISHVTIQYSPFIYHKCDLNTKYLEDLIPLFGLISFLFFFFTVFCSFMFPILLFSMNFQVHRSRIKCFLHLLNIVTQIIEKKVWIVNVIVNGMIGYQKKYITKVLIQYSCENPLSKTS